jgi:outer membrane protein assembly factor BamB
VAGLYPATPAYHAAIIYIANNNPLQLEARSEADGSLLWSWTPPQDAYFTSEVLITNNLAFICTNLATYAVDTQTHELVWSYPLTGRLALSASGVLYIAVGQPSPGPSSVTAINVK